MKGPPSINLQRAKAESEGFEPPVPLPVHRISSAARSTTPAAFLSLSKPAKNQAVKLALITLYRKGKAKIETKKVKYFFQCGKYIL